MKNWKKIVRILLILVVAIPAAALIAVQVPAVQTAIVGKVTDKLSDHLDGKAHIGGVYFSFPNNVILKDVDVIQGAEDTVAHLGKVLVSLKASSLLFSREARVKRVSVEDGRIAIRHINDSTTNLAALIAPLRKDEPSGPLSLPWDDIHVNQVTLKHIDFSTDSLDVRDINLSVRDVRYGETASARLENLTFREDSRGLQVDRMSGDVSLDSTGLAVRDLRLNDGRSDLNADLTLGFKDFSDFSEFLDKVNIDANLRDSQLDLQTIKAITGADLPDLALRLDGRVRGTVGDLRSDKLSVRSASGKTSALTRFHLKGLPDMDKARIEAEIFNGTTTSADLADIISRVSPGVKKSSIARIAPGETISLSGKANGTLANLSFDARLGSESMGAATLEGILHKGAHVLQADASATTESLNLGRILGQKDLGPLTCRTDVSLSSHGKNFSVAADPLHIDSFTYRGYQYHDITASGDLQGDRIQARVTSGDPNLQMTLNADADLGGRGRENRYIIDLDLDYANLEALHFDPRDSTALSLALDADVVQTPQGAFLGKADVKGMKATLRNRDFDIGDISLSSTYQHEIYTCLLNSDIARAQYNGNIFVSDFVSRSIHKVMEDNVERLLEHEKARHEDTPHPEDFGSLRLQLLDLRNFLDFFVPDLYVAPQSTVGIDLIDDDVTGTLSSELLAYRENFLRNVQGRFFTDDDHMMADFDVDRFQSGSLTAENVRLDAAADSTFIDLKASFQNEDDSGNAAKLHAQLEFLDQEEDGYQLRADILPSELTVAGDSWQLTPSTLFYRDKHLRIDDFALQNGLQSLRANGVVGTSTSDTVQVFLHDFDIAFANSFLGDGYDLRGTLTGRGEGFCLLGEKRGILLDLDGKQIAMAGVELGDFDLGSHWDNAQQRFNFDVANTLAGRHPIDAKAWYRPSDKQANLDLKLDSLAMGILQPLLSTLVSDVGGSVSGHVQAHGPISKLALESDGARFNKLKFKLLYTQVDYEADGPFTVGTNGVIFNDIALRDNFGHVGRLNGGVPYDHFKDLRLDARINLQNLQVLNTNLRDNETFYGQAFADGSVRLSGPLNRIRLSLVLTPRQNTTLHIPLGNSAKQSQSLLTFINNEEKVIGLYDSLLLAKQTVKKEKKGGSSSDLSVNLRLNANPDAEIQLEVDKNSGDILKARGNGQIGITVASGNFDIKGDYRVDSGSYHFGMLGFTSRDFSIDPGGTIGFNGDVMQSDLDLTATYRTKASISPLIADSTAVSTRRTVECGISVTGKLANPQITFNISVPDLDPTTQNRIESALNTEDKRMKQALALLISGGFVPDEQSGIVNSTTLLYSNASEMMASQLNNIFRQLDIPLDLGFNYQPSESGRDIFDVAVSTQLFNNRVSINGNIGNRQYISSTASDIVGDLEIEIKLNRQGQVRLTLFSHSADQYSNSLDLSQRNGAGIVYQEDFNTLGELWRKIFHIKNPDERPTPPDSNAPRRPQPE